MSCCSADSEWPSGAMHCPKVSPVEHSGLQAQRIVACQQPIQTNRLSVALCWGLDWVRQAKFDALLFYGAG